MTNTRSSATLPTSARWTVRGQGPKAHFFHANGFGPGAYEPLLGRLSERFEVHTLAMRATWPEIGPPPRRRDWQLYADDLVAYLDQEVREPVVGIGHSMGATCTALAAVQRPDLFTSLILIEPAMVSVGLARLFRCLPKFLVSRIEPSRSTLRKRDHWPSRDEYLAKLRTSRVYRRFGDEALAALADGNLRERADGAFELTFPKDWEAHNYTQPPNILWALRRIERPFVALRGKPSIFLTEALWESWKASRPDGVFLAEPAAGHLFPLEDPERCHELVLEGLRSLASDGP